mmetsp:Transcript_18731/g.59709  ORF Transcript_18731/g.59709 Transcript_18731/m.59709 type:complete len:337 (-) Transcript_18731:229-1239(-)
MPHSARAGISYCRRLLAAEAGAGSPTGVARRFVGSRREDEAATAAAVAPGLIGSAVLVSRRSVGGPGVSSAAAAAANTLGAHRSANSGRSVRQAGGHRTLNAIESAIHNAHPTRLRRAQDADRPKWSWMKAKASCVGVAEGDRAEMLASAESGLRDATTSMARTTCSVGNAQSMLVSPRLATLAGRLKRSSSVWRRRARRPRAADSCVRSAAFPPRRRWRLGLAAAATVAGWGATESGPAARACASEASASSSRSVTAAWARSVRKWGGSRRGFPEQWQSKRRCSHWANTAQRVRGALERSSAAGKKAEPAVCSLAVHSRKEWDPVLTRCGITTVT